MGSGVTSGRRSPARADPHKAAVMCFCMCWNAAGDEQPTAMLATTTKDTRVSATALRARGKVAHARWRTGGRV